MAYFSFPHIAADDAASLLGRRCSLRSSSAALRPGGLQNGLQHRGRRYSLPGSLRDSDVRRCLTYICIQSIHSRGGDRYTVSFVAPGHISVLFEIIE